MRVRREAKPAMFFRNDHPEELVPLDEIPRLGRQVTPFPVDLPVIEHGAEFVDRALEKGLLLLRQGRGRLAQELRPVGITGEEISVPPDVAGLERLTLG